MLDAATKIFDRECPNRHVLDLIADKWSVLILAVLFDDPTRFNALKRRLDGITQKALTDALRRLERNGIVVRRVITSSPVAVEYSVTPLGRTLGEPFAALYRWTIEHHEDVDRAQALFDARVEAA
ncbi:MAG: winged helix-turn-helix transcriptional regulator [Janthinobacterium lividum]